MDGEVDWEAGTAQQLRPVTVIQGQPTPGEIHVRRACGAKYGDEHREADPEAPHDALSHPRG